MSMLARSWLVALCLCGAARAAAPPETPVHAELLQIKAQYQEDRPAAIQRLQELQDHRPSSATFEDRSKTLITLINFYVDSGDARARRYIDELAALGERQHDLESILWAQNYRARVLTLFDAKPAEGARLVEQASPALCYAAQR